MPYITKNLMGHNTRPYEIQSKFQLSRASVYQMVFLKIIFHCNSYTERLNQLWEGIIEAALNKARQMPWSVALRKVAWNITLNRRPIFVVSWDPWLPSVSAITNKHWRTMTQDPLMKEIFPEPPLIAYKRQRNIGDKIIRAKVTPNIPYPKRNITGMKKCQKQCHVFLYIQERK